MKILCRIFLLVFLISACSPKNHILPTTAAVVNEPESTATATPVYTAVPTATPEPVFSEAGPFLLFERVDEAATSFWVLDNETFLQQQVKLPENYLPSAFANGISPDGSQWLVFGNTLQGLTLNLYHFGSQEITELINLSPRKITNPTLLQHLISNIWWQNDGSGFHYLALINTDTTALHYFTLKNRQSSSLDEMPAFVRTVDFSEADAQILLVKDSSLSQFSQPAIYHIQSEQLTTVDLPDLGDFSHFDLFWVKEDMFGLAGGYSAGQFSKLYLVSTKTYQPQLIYEGIFRNFLVEKQNIFLSGENFPAIMQVSPEGILTQIPTTGYCPRVFNSGYDNWGVLFFCPESIWAFTSENTIRQFSAKPQSISISPNGAIKLSFSPSGSPGVVTLDDNFESEQVILDEPANQIIWRQDSSGFFFRNLSGFHYLDLSSGNITTIDAGRTDDYRDIVIHWVDF